MCGAAGCASVRLRTGRARAAATERPVTLPAVGVTTHPSQDLLGHEVHAPVLGPQVDLALQPGVGAHDEAGAVVGAVARALTVVGGAGHGAGG